MNPYIILVSKRLRNLKKKEKKIIEVDSLRQSGKILIEDQLAILASRQYVERNIEDLESIKNSMEEIWKEEQEKLVSPPVVTNVSIQVDVPSPPPPPPPVVEPIQIPIKTEPIAIEEIGAKVRQILRALHVYQVYTKTGKPLPPALVFFSQSLLGLTSVQSFADTLDSSVRTAGLFLDVRMIFTILPN